MASESERGLEMQGVDDLPVQVPVELFAQQHRLGVDAVLLWINLLFFAQQRKRLTLRTAAEQMGISMQRVEQAFVKLAEHGWVNDSGYTIRLAVSAAEAAEPIPTGDSLMLDEEQAGFEWLVNFWTHKVAAPSAEDMQRLYIWTDERGMSHEVVAAAIEEMCSSVDRPNIGYLEGILRNWLQEGVTSYADLTSKPYLSKVLPQTRREGVHPEAERKWKEFFPDEFHHQPSS